MSGDPTGQRPRLSTTLSGVAGAYFVAAELSRRRYIAPITLRNTDSVDILASNVAGTRIIGIQVKANQGAESGWIVQNTVEDEVEGENLFFVFISLDGLGAPRYHVAQRTEVAEQCRESHERRLGTLRPRRLAAPKNSPMLKFVDPQGPFRGRPRPRWQQVRRLCVPVGAR